MQVDMWLRCCGQPSEVTGRVSHESMNYAVGVVLWPSGPSGRAPEKSMNNVLVAVLRATKGTRCVSKECMDVPVAALPCAIG